MTKNTGVETNTNSFYNTQHNGAEAEMHMHTRNSGAQTNTIFLTEFTTTTQVL